MHIIHPAVRAVAKSLRENPSQWAAGLFELTHSAEVVVWRRNRPYGMEISVDGRRVWGGVTFLSSFGLSPSYWALHRALSRWERGSGEDLRVRLGLEEAA